MADGAEKMAQEYKDSLKASAEDLLMNGFPRKILELNELLKTAQLCHTNLPKVHGQLNIPVPEPVAMYNHVEQPTANVSGTKVMALTHGSVPSNKHLCDLVLVVKPHIRQLVEDANLLKMWISLLIPKIEDGNNFGVSIQEDTLAEIMLVERKAAAFFGQISQYFVTRGKMISKVAKYPHIDDYRRAVEELDEKEYLSLWLVMCEVRNHYCSVHDMVIKNLEKLKQPRTSNADSLY